MRPLTKPQRQFLEGLENSKPLDDLMKDLGISNAKLMQWMRTQFFTKALTLRKKAMREKARLEIIRAGAHAAKRKALVVYGTKTGVREIQRKMWNDATREAGITLARHKLPPIQEPKPVQSPIHPDVAHRAADLLAELAAARKEGSEIQKL